MFNRIFGSVRFTSLNIGAIAIPRKPADPNEGWRCTTPMPPRRVRFVVDASGGENCQPQMTAADFAAGLNRSK